MSRSLLTVEMEQDALPLPSLVRERYGLKPVVAVRIIETRNGILLVPLADAPMSLELKEELTIWQEASQQSWQMFPYNDEETE